MNGREGARGILAPLYTPLRTPSVMHHTHVNAHRGRLTLPRGADLAKLREKGGLQRCVDISQGGRWWQG